MSEKLFGGVLNDPVPAPTCHICGQHGGHAFDCHDDREDARIRALSTPTAHDALIAEAREELGRAVEFIDELLPYIDAYFRDKWKMDERRATFGVLPAKEASHAQD